MQMEWVNIGLGFIEGFALIISPCILPILPIILAGSLTGSKRRPFGIIVGFVIVFALFTFFSRAIVQTLGLDLTLVRHLSYVILLLLGVVMMSTMLTEKFGMITRGLANTGSNFSSVNDAQGGFFSGIVFGGLIALVWTPCAGPILAAVIVQSIVQESNLQGFLIIIAFSVGASVPMLLISLFGRRVTAKFSFLKSHATLFRKLLGLIIVASVVYIVSLEAGVGVETAASKNFNGTIHALEKGLDMPYPAPAIGKDDVWINSSPLVLSELKGKVVLIDFWTYSCINCIRTLPYIKSWYNQYHDKGLVIIGIHAPEFEFEKSLDNVKRAVVQDGIQYPVALDNDYTTWRNFKNQYWPAHYLIDKNGNVVYTHFGEGEYDVTENNIRYLLGMNQPVAAAHTQDAPRDRDQTPETYIGYARSDHFASPEPIVNNGSGLYSFPEELGANRWAFKGRWIIFSDRAIAEEANASLKIHFKARKVYLVMGNATAKPIVVKLHLNGKDLVAEKGKDVVQSRVSVTGHTLYEVVVQPASVEGMLEVTAESPGLEVYTFTFG